MEQVLTLRTNTSSYTLQDVKDEILECAKLVAELGYPDLRINKYLVSFSTRRVKNFATCTKVGDHQYKIVVNQHYLELASADNVHNTLMHEVIHSVPGCMNHKDPWKRVAKKVNATYTFTEIKRLGHDDNYWKEYASQHKRKLDYAYVVTCDECGHQWRYKKKCTVVNTAEKGTCTCPYCKSHWFTVSSY